MSAEKVNVGGISYNAVGSSSAPLLLLSNGIIRLQWGSSCIDLIKDGKVTSTSITDLQKLIAELTTKVEELTNLINNK